MLDLWGSLGFGHHRFTHSTICLKMGHLSLSSKPPNGTLQLLEEDPCGGEAWVSDERTKLLCSYCNVLHGLPETRPVGSGVRRWRGPLGDCGYEKPGITD